MFGINRKRRFNRNGIAAVEAAVCFPVLVIIWLGTFEVSRRTTLQQQAQLLAASTAHRVQETDIDFGALRSETADLAQALGLEDVQVQISRHDNEVIESTVSMDFTKNSPISTFLRGRQVSSVYYSYREE